MTFFHYWRPFGKPLVDGSKVIGAVKLNQQMYRIEATPSSNANNKGGAVLHLRSIFARVFHPLDKEVQAAVIELWIEDRKRLIAADPNLLNGKA